MQQRQPLFFAMRGRVFRQTLNLREQHRDIAEILGGRRVPPPQLGGRWCRQNVQEQLFILANLELQFLGLVLQSRRHFVEGVGQFAEFIAGRHRGQRSHLPPGDALSGRRQRSDRSQEQVRQQQSQQRDGDRDGGRHRHHFAGEIPNGSKRFFFVHFG